MTSLAARFDRSRAMFAPSPMIMPRSAAAVSAAASAAGRDEDELVELGGGDVAQSPAAGRLGGPSSGAIDRLGVVRALDDAARDELGRQLGVAVEPRRRAASARWPATATARPPRRRSAEAPTRTTVSRSSVAGSPMPTVRSRPAGSSPAAASDVAKRLPVSSPKAASAPELAAGAPVELVERALEGGLPDDGDDEDVGL